MARGPWGLRSEQDERATGGVKVSSPQLHQFACEQCGAILSYAPGTAELECSYCGHRNRIHEAPVEVVEQALAPAVRAHGGEAPPAAAIAAKCVSCGADFSFDPPRFAGPCPFCGKPVVADPGPYRSLPPQGVLPFLVGDQEARRLVGEWLKGLWFAPSGIAQQARGPGRLHGVYLPHWTFDSRTSTAYAGRRGDVYYETQYVDTVINGRHVRQAVQVPKIRWRPVMGQVARQFDDVLVLASATLPQHLVEELEPWDLEGMRPFTADYLSGFDAELYQVPVDQGFERAQAAMREVIAMDIRHDIGGDQQVIERMEVQHGDPTFKHVLLPVWVAAFQFLGRPYKFVVNGRTGEVHGERPYSFWKIAGAVLLGLLLFLLLALFLSQAETLQQLPAQIPYWEVPRLQRH
jgi:predicted RNA-binding Zn-ribbon protein involved in translation (DUF1610 family)